MSNRKQKIDNSSQYRQVQDNVLALERLGHLNKLHKLIEEIHKSNISQTLNFKEDLKIILNNCVDII